MTVRPLRVVVADDERATRRLLTSRLKSCPAVQVVGEAESASQAIEARLDPRRFVRFSRSTLASVDQIRRITTTPGGTCTATLANGQQPTVSRIQSRMLRETLLKL